MRVVDSVINALYTGDWATSDEVLYAIMSLFSMLYVYALLALFKLGHKAWCAAGSGRSADAGDRYLTLYSSAITTVFSLHFAYRWGSRSPGAWAEPMWGSCVQESFLNVALEEYQLARCLAIFFVSYCIMDLVIGLFEYEEKIEYDSGWIHHIFYIFLLVFLLHNNLTGVFAIAMIEELPTFILGCWRVRSKTAKLPGLFGLVFFLTRICFHLYLSYKVYDISQIGFLCTLLVLNQHINWFRRWVVGHMQRSASGTKSLTSRLAGLASLVVLQIAGHGYVGYRLSTNHNTGSVVAIIVHVFTFCFFTIRLMMMLNAAYSENFVSDAITKRKIIYNISWEDPAIDHRVCHTGKGDVVLTIASAGCNALDYLVQGVDTVVAADLNVAQLATLELKLVGFKHLPYDDFFAVWGESDYATFKRVYPKLRPDLTSDSQSFWDANCHLIRDNFMYAGTSGMMAYILSFPLGWTGIIRHMEARTGQPPKGPLTSLTLFLARIVLSRYWVWSWLAPLGGVPLSQLKLMERKPEVFVERILQIATRDMWTKDNYFYYGYITGKFSRDCCPRYLEEQHFAYCKENCHRVTPFRGTWAEAAQTRSDFTLYSLLDSMDWMPPAMVADSVGRIIPQLNREKGRIFWRSFAKEAHSPALAHLKSRVVPDVDRVGWYMGQFVVSKLTDKYNPEPLLLKETPSVITSSLYNDAKVMAIMAYYGLFSKEKDAVEFYKSQGKEYDGFREALLPDRGLLLQHVVPWTSSPKTWVSVGCGTARDIEYVVQHIKNAGTRVYLVDLSPALLEMAKIRVNELGISEQCEFILGDITSKKCLKKLPRSVDLVTCSYCLTMIPNWEEAVSAMISMLKKGGNLCVIDFTSPEGHACSLEQRFYRWWFAHDGVWLDHKQTQFLRERLNTRWFSESEERLPYTFFYPTHYLFCGEA